MRTLIDGSNLLGALRLDREGVESKRELLRAVVSWARRRKAKVVVFFDGPRPDAFATSLGAVTARFTEPRPADDLIVAELEKLARERFTVVTSDQDLARRCRRRGVEIMDSRAFAREIESGEGEESGPDADDWSAYFSDPNNRNV